MASAEGVRRAGPADAQAIAEILDRAFMNEPVNCWVFPDPADRARRQPGFFRLYADHALAIGEVYLTTDGGGAALWRYIDPAIPPAGVVPEDLLARACGPHYPRMRTLLELLAPCHQRQHRHWYVPFIGVRPGRQGSGLGAALLRDRLAALDVTGVPAYLEASSARSRRLYQRLGFAPLPTTVTLPDGPPLFPMWRPAGAGR
jgi:GNAT superfamily N-acetyltransferase